jgi:hypothetical protein
MSATLTTRVLEATPRDRTLGKAAGVGMALGVAGIAIGAMSSVPNALWTALIVTTAMVAGVAVVGVLFSAIFQITGARWGRAYRRLSEACVAFGPVALLGLIVLMAGGNAYLPWVHEHPHVGGKAIWLTRGFWDARVLLSLLLTYGLSWTFVYYSLRADFCIEGVAQRFSGRLASWVGKDIKNPERERARCEARLDVLAPIVAIVYGLLFTLLGFDLIMALEPDWFSPLFGAWYFMGNMFAGLALLALVSMPLRKKLGLHDFLTEQRQSDMATILFGFCLVHTDFFWSQYLTIWYANMPEETYWLIERTADKELPWGGLSWVSLMAFFTIPFIALLFRKVKRNDSLLALVSVIVVLGVLLVRYLEVAPALSGLEPGAGMGAALVPLLASIGLFCGALGLGLVLYSRFLTAVPILPIGDSIFEAHATEEEGH